MKKLFRVLLFLLALVLLAGLAGVLSTIYTIPWLTGFTHQMMNAYPWLSLALAIVLMVYIVLTVAFIIFVCVAPSKKNIYTIHKNMGRLEITRQSIESAAGITLQNIPAVKRYAVHVKGNPTPGKVKLAIQVETKDAETLASLGEEIQTRVAQDLENSLAIKPEHVKVRIEPYTIQQRDSAHNHKSIPRVV